MNRDAKPLRSMAGKKGNSGVLKDNVIFKEQNNRSGSGKAAGGRLQGMGFRESAQGGDKERRARVSMMVLRDWQVTHRVAIALGSSRAGTGIFPGAREAPLFMISGSSRIGTGTGILLEARRAVSSYRYDGSSRTGTGTLLGSRDASFLAFISLALHPNSPC